MQQEDFQYHIERLVGWAAIHHCKVEFEHATEDRFEFEGRTIFINTQSSLENQLFTLLHECGHVLIHKSNKQFASDYPFYAHADSVYNSARIVRSKAYQVSLVAEEIEAWKRGKRLAKRLSMPIDIDKYNTVMTNCVTSYIIRSVSINYDIKSKRRRKK
tara:strand:+ start:282 stop:758 length:477 start_codon:yes stop_codon:yes gene_type:complete